MIDVIIPAHEKDIDTLECCITGVKNNIQDVENIYVISKNKLTDSAIWYPEKKLPFLIEDVAKIIGKHWRTAWYYADLLEGCASIYIDGPSDYALILDADTVFLRPVSLIKNGKSLLNTSPSDGSNAYYEYIIRLLKDSPLYLLHDFKSGVSHWILQEKSIVTDMVKQVEEIHGKPFWKAALDVTCQKYHCLYDNSHETGPGKMANFELYFNYALKYYPDRATIHKQNSILAYKESLGISGYKRSGVSRTNTQLFASDRMNILTDDEKTIINKMNFSSLSQAIAFACEVCAHKGWDVMTFQKHVWMDIEKYKNLTRIESNYDYSN